MYKRLYNPVVMEPTHQTFVQRVKRWFLRAVWISWAFILFIADKALESSIANVRIMWKEFDLFFGTALVIIGLFSFNTGRYCDGNSAEYLSCTRPSAYYYFNGFDILLLMLGIFFILLWFQKNKQQKESRK